LQLAIGWEDEEFAKFTVSQVFHVPKITKLPSQQKYVNDEVGKKLDITICYSKQKREDLDKVIQSVRIRAIFQMFLLPYIQTAKLFKIQDRYCDDWPIRNALKLRLKYMSDWEKKKGNRRIEAKLRQALKPKDN
jgi:hypothetical protein